MASMKISGKDRVILTVFPDDYSKYSIIYRKKCIIE
jgi:translation initiation factor IF-1